MKISSIFFKSSNRFTKFGGSIRSGSMNGTKLGRHNSTQSIHKQKNLLSKFKPDAEVNKHNKCKVLNTGQLQIANFHWIMGY